MKAAKKGVLPIEPKKLIPTLRRLFGMSKILAYPQRILLRLVGLNVALDFLSIPLWFALSFLENPFYQSPLNVNVSIAIVDAPIAAALFALALLGVMKRQKWGAYVAIGGTIGQRIVGYFAFPLNVGMAIEVVWSIVIIYFAYRFIRQLQTPKISS
jgi:hypothetical protein